MHLNCGIISEIKIQNWNKTNRIKGEIETENNDVQPN